MAISVPIPKWASAVSGLVAPSAHGGAAGGETDRGHPVLKRGAGRDEAPQARADQRMGGEAPRPRNVGHPGPLAERVHAVPHRDHGRVRASRRRDGHHLQEPQTGGSECGHNIVGYCIDRLPGPVMYVFPDELTARENAKDRIIPMIEASPRLRQYMTATGTTPPACASTCCTCRFILGWSGSVSRLGNKPIRILILDELDKYKNPKNEASSESLAEKRTTTWRTRRKVVKISTPTTDDGPIWKALTEEAGARFDFWGALPALRLFPAHGFRAHRMARKG